jgi:NTE family protein
MDRDSAYPRRALAIAASGVFVAFLDTTIVNIAFPSIRASFPGSSVAALSWVLTGYNVVFAAFLVPAGRLADVLGRRRMFVIGLSIFTAASVLCALAPSVEVLVGARVVQASGSAMLVPASLGLFLPFFPLAKRATAIGIWAAAGGIAGGVGPSLGGILVDVASWRWVFLVNVPIGLFTIYLAQRRVKETHEANRQIPDLLSAVLLAGSTGALALGIVKGHDWGWMSVDVVTSFAAALTFALAFALRTRRVGVSAFAFELFRIRSFAVANAATLLFATGVFAVVLANVLFLTSVWHYSVLSAGLATTPTPIITGIIAGPAGRLAERVGHRIVIALGTLTYATGVGYYVLNAGTDVAFARDWLPGAMLAGIGIGLAFPVLSSAALAAVPADRFATASGINATARQLGAVLGVAILVAILGSVAGGDLVNRFDSGWLFGLTAAVASCAIAMRMGQLSTPGPSHDAYTEASLAEPISVSQPVSRRGT